MLLAHSTLSDHRVKRIIRCYAHEKTPREAMEICGISHVTIYRLYGLIRQRLLHVGIYRTHEDVDLTAAVEEDFFGSFPWDEFNAHMAHELGKHRGIRPENEAAYFGEALFRYRRRYTPEQFNNLILLAVKLSGPLNLPPRPYNVVTLGAERMRLGLMKVKTSLKKAKLTVTKISEMQDTVENLKSKRIIHRS